MRRPVNSASEAAAFYTQWAALYDRLAVATPGVSQLRAAFLDSVDLATGDVVVEMGCGTGANFPYIRERIGRTGTIVGIDISPGVLQRAQQRIHANGWDNVHVVRADATRPPLIGDGQSSPAGSFGLGAEAVDAVIAAFLVGMLSEPAQAVRDWAALAGDGGQLGLCNLARSTTPAGRFLNPVFSILVRATAPPGGRSRQGNAARILDERVLSAHRTLREVCEETNTRRMFGGFTRIAAGTIRREAERTIRREVERSK